jgi:hypothetical protein
MRHTLPLAILLAGAALAASQAQAAGVAVVSPAATVAAQPTGPMQTLALSAQRLRDSIQLLSQQPASAERDAAIARARLALRETNLAMNDLAPMPGTYVTPTPPTGTLGAGPATESDTRTIVINRANCTPLGDMWACR